MLQQDFHRGSNPAYDKVAFVADHYDELVYMYQDILEKLKAGGSSGSDGSSGSGETHQSSGEGLFETKEVTFIPYYIAINKDFFEDNTTIPNPPGGSRTYDLTLTPKQIFGGTPEEIAKRIKGNCTQENAERVFSNAVYTDTVSRTTTRYKRNPSSNVYENITETKEYYVFAINSPVQSGVECYLNSNLYKYYKDNRISKQLFNEYFYGYPDSSGDSAGSNMFFYILEKNPNVSSDDYTVWDCVDMCKKYEDFTFTEVIPKGNVVMTYLGGN